MVEPLSYERLSATTLAFKGDGNRSAASGKQSRKETFIVAPNNSYNPPDTH